MVIGLEPLKLCGTALERRQKKEIERLRAALMEMLASLASLDANVLHTVSLDEAIKQARLTLRGQRSK